MAKVFSNISTIVELNDKQKLTFVELEVRFPKDNELIEEMLKKHYNCKMTVDADDRAIWKMNLRTDEKSVLQAILKSLEEFDNKFLARTKTVSDLMDLLK